MAQENIPDKNDGIEILEIQQVDNTPITALQIFEESILKGMANYGLPTDGIFVSLEERGNVFKNIEGVLLKISEPQRASAVYFSKFLAATAAGLFDAALNYLWDETISEIRKRVIQYDIGYFYDNATNDEEKRKKLKGADDITRLDDSELIQGARNIGLISELGYKHLDYIRFMRNWASAAHPNQNEITGLQLISWLETCIKEVISLPISNIAIEIKRLLSNIKTNELSESEARQIASSFIELDQQQVNNLASGFLGIYVDSESAAITCQNISYLAPYLWGRVDENTRQSFGIKYGKYVANNDQTKAQKTKSYLEIVDGISYIPDSLKVFDIEAACQNLLAVHHSYNNFYNEPIFAKHLFNTIGEGNNIPEQIRKPTVLAIAKVFLTNGNGVANAAEPYYIKMIKQFNQEEAIIALLSFTDEQIASKLQFSLCGRKFKELLSLIKGKLSAPAIKELFDQVESFPGNLDIMKNDSNIKRKIENVQKILNS